MTPPLSKLGVWVILISLVGSFFAQANQSPAKKSSSLKRKKPPVAAGKKKPAGKKVVIAKAAVKAGGEKKTAAPGVDPSKSTAVVPNGTFGQSTTIVVRCCDARGKAMKAVGVVVTAKISGSNQLSLTLSDNHDGSYEASYTPKKSGADSIDIAVNGKSVKGSPYNSTVWPSLVIRSATYGDLPDGMTLNVTDKVRAFVKFGSVSFQAADGNFGDPYNGTLKLTINKVEVKVPGLNFGGVDGAGDVTDTMKQFQDGNSLHCKSSGGDQKFTVYYNYGDGKERTKKSMDDGSLDIVPPTKLRVDFTLDGVEMSKTVDLGLMMDIGTAPKMPIETAAATPEQKDGDKTELALINSLNTRMFQAAHSRTENESDQVSLGLGMMKAFGFHVGSKITKGDFWILGMALDFMKQCVANGYVMDDAAMKTTDPARTRDLFHRTFTKKQIELLSYEVSSEKTKDSSARERLIRDAGYDEGK